MMAAVQPKKWNWWYDRIIDWMILNPERTKGDCARELNCSESWLSIITNSDMFRDAFTARSKEVTGAVLLGVREKGLAAAERSLDALNKRLEIQADVLPITTLLEITDVTMKRFGYGGVDKKSSGPAVQNNYFMGQVSPQELANARDSMAQVATSRREARELVLIEGVSPGDGENEDGRGSDP